jgi:cytochrome c-type biogenesis protein CcmH/NrfG
MSDDTNQEILEELRKIRTGGRRLYYLIAVFVIICAIPVFRQGASQSSDSWQQVRTAMDRQDFHKALSMAHALVASQPDYSYGHSYLGYIYLSMGDINNAETQYSRAYELFPGEDNQKDLAAVQKRLGTGGGFKLLYTQPLTTNAAPMPN